MYKQRQEGGREYHRKVLYRLRRTSTLHLSEQIITLSLQNYQKWRSE
jgi:hypothetical protein